MLFPVKTFFSAINSGQTARMAFDRIEKVFGLQRIAHSRELSSALPIPIPTEVDPNPIGRVQCSATGFLWEKVFPARADKSKDGSLVFVSLDLQFEPGQHIGVFGRVGCGKTTLLRLLLGEVTPVSGSVEAFGKLAFCAQESFLLSGTIKDNILFGENFNSERFESVIDLCELRHDINKFALGADTVVGENGVKLSGGQKQRVCLARAAYCRPDVVVLDDPMSALDADVKSKVWRNLIGGLWSQTTIVMSTNDESVRNEFDTVIEIEDMQVAGSSNKMKDLKLEEPNQQNIANNKSVANILENNESRKTRNDFKINNSNGFQPSNPNQNPFSESGRVSRSSSRGPERPEVRQFEEVVIPSGIARPQTHLEYENKQENIPILVENEVQTKNVGPVVAVDEITKIDKFQAGQGEREPLNAKDVVVSSTTQEAQVTLGVKKEKPEIASRVEPSIKPSNPIPEAQSPSTFTLLQYPGRFVFFVAMFFWILFTSSRQFFDYWLGQWSSSSTATFQTPTNERPRPDTNPIYPGLCGGALVLALICLLTRSLLYTVLSKNTASRLHRSLVSSLLHKSLSYFDLTPTGTITNRATKDVGVVDNQLLMNFLWLLTNLMQFAAFIVVATAAVPVLLLFFVLAVLVAVWLVKKYTRAALKLRKLSVSSAAPFLQGILELFQGLETIRAFGQKKYICERFMAHLNSHNNSVQHELFARQWINVRMELLISLLVGLVAFAVAIVSSVPE